MSDANKALFVSYSIIAQKLILISSPTGRRLSISCSVKLIDLQVRIASVGRRACERQSNIDSYRLVSLMTV